MPADRDLEASPNQCVLVKKRKKILHSRMFRVTSVLATFITFYTSDSILLSIWFLTLVFY
ncbi:hypothetical protein GBAR_LOCUS2188 [Geodia barretti]|uniref:Transmembrane protein n=1 Tax=Geodia barretti TaxID=519541 RepID=A0AA35QZ17_GEOBA|nr:hypothetical protein GBAR_LOCUS2188 [Geodia barretti]